MASLIEKDIVNELHGGNLATQRTAENIEAAKSKVDSLKKKLEKQTAKENAGAETAPGNWTHIYSVCEDYEDAQELEYAVQEESKRLQDLSENAMLSAHQHDHADERAMFEKPEKEKMEICERYRELGNLLFAEGLDFLPRAAHQYQLALSYYEYCFPQTEEEQDHINRVKYACQCNVSYCYYRMGYYREAINAATLAINDREVEAGAKAYFRRAQAYQKLDEYSRAATDYKMAALLSPTDAGIAEAIVDLQNQVKRSNKKDKELAGAWIAGVDAQGSSHAHSSHDSEENPKNNVSVVGRKGTTAAVDLNREMSMLMSLTMPVEPVIKSTPTF